MTDAIKTAGKPRGKPFQKGNRANPSGRPTGSRNKATLLLDQLAEGGACGILRKIIVAAKKGNLRAAELVLSRIWPVRKGRPVSLDLPAIKSATDVVAAIGLVADAVGDGTITPDEGQALSAVLEVKRRAIETVDLEARVTELEKGRKR
jgi:hypothetical protein